MSDSPLSRRSFLKTGSTLAGLAAVAPVASIVAGDGTRETAPCQAPAPRPMPYLYPNPGRIVIVEHPGAVTGTSTVNAAIVQQMFDEGIMALTGVASSPAEALASLLPGLTTAKKIALKPNLINSSVPTRKELVKAVITRLVQMLGGFPAANITLYEDQSFSASGYTTAYFGQSVHLVVDTSFPNLGYTIHCNGKDRPYSKSLYEADYLINMPVLKDHSCSSSFNMTLSFKNHMGTLNPGGSLGVHCDKVAMLDVMADAVMTTKQRLVILDCLLAIYNGGPGGSPQAQPKKIMLSQDPVTIDSQGRIAINALRTQNGLSPKTAGYIDEAAAAPRSIGIADPALMTIVNVYLPVRLASFTAVIEDDAVALAWSTETETNNAGFHVERRPKSSDAWTRVAFLPGRGTTASRSEYRHRDALDAALRLERAIEYRLRQVDTDGGEECSPSVTVVPVLDEDSWLLEQNYPNPFPTTTDIPLALSRDTDLRLEVVDAAGRRVALLHDGPAAAGQHYYRWDASAQAAGIYLGRATVAGASKEIQLIVLR
jgi:uncharacterized protein (DUF362 family)